MDNKMEQIPLLPKEKKRWTQTKNRKLLILAACMYLHFMSLGFSACLGVLYVELIRYFDTERSLAALVQSCYQGLTYLGGIIFAAVVTKFGVGFPVTIASLVGASFIFLSIFSVNIYMVIIFVGVIGGINMSINYLCAFVAISWTFDTHRRAALAALTVATGISQVVLPNIASVLIDVYGWSGTLIIASGLMFHSVPCGVLLIVSGKYFNKITNEDNTDVKSVFTCMSKLDIAFIIFVVVSSVYPSTGAIEAWFLVDLTVNRGFSRQEGTLLYSLMGGFGLTGRLLGTAMLKIFSSLRAAVPMAVAFQGFAVGHFLIIYMTSYYGMLIGTLFRGISIGCIMALQPVMVLELRGMDKFPKSVAICNFLCGLAQISYGYIGGSIADLTGEYDLAFYISTAAASICGLLMLIIKCLINVHKK